MAQVNWKGMADRLTNATSRLGHVVQITRKERGAYTPIPGRNIERGQAADPLSGNFNAVLSKPKRTYDSNTTTYRMAQFIVSPGPFEPQEGDTIVSNGLQYEIIEAHVVRPNGKDPVIFNCKAKL